MGDKDNSLIIAHQRTGNDQRSGTSMSLMQRLTSWSQPARFGGLWQTFSTRLSFEKHLPNSVFNPYSWQVQARFKHRSVWSPLNLDKFPLASVGNQRQGHHVEQLKDMSVRLQEQTPMYFPGNDVYERRWSMYRKYREIPKEKTVRFTFASYNILAQNLLEDHDNMYTADEQYLQWEYRKKNLIAELLHLSPDIICLQEVHKDHYIDDLLPALEPSGYKAEFLKRTGDKQDGCATFYKSNKFVLHHREHVHYMVRGVSVLNRDNVGLILVLKAAEDADNKEDTQLVVANTHLLFNPKRGDVKLAQLQYLLAEIDKLAFKQQSDKDMSNVYHPILLCGDFNMTPFCNIWEFLHKGKLKYEGLSQKTMSGQSTYNDHRQHSRLSSTLLPKSMGITDQCQLKTCYDARHATEESEHVDTSEIDELRQIEGLKLKTAAAAASKKRSTSSETAETSSSHDPSHGHGVSPTKSRRSNQHHEEGDGYSGGAPTRAAHEVVIRKEDLQKSNQSGYAHHRHDPHNQPHAVVMTKDQVHHNYAAERDVDAPSTSTAGTSTGAASTHRKSAVIFTKEQIDSGAVHIEENIADAHGHSSVVYEEMYEKEKEKYLFNKERFFKKHHDDDAGGVSSSRRVEQQCSFQSGWLSHDFNFATVHDHVRRLNGRRSNEVTTCHSRANVTVDYIFYSRGKEYPRHRLIVLRALSLYDQNDMKRIGHLPNKYISSDHTILMAEFDWYIGEVWENVYDKLNTEAKDNRTKRKQKR